MFKYRRLSYNKDTNSVTQATLNMSTIKLYEMTGQMTINAFLSLLNKWNRQNNTDSRVIHIYTMED